MRTSALSAWLGQGSCTAALFPSDCLEVVTMSLPPNLLCAEVFLCSPSVQAALLAAVVFKHCTSSSTGCHSTGNRRYFRLLSLSQGNICQKQQQNSQPGTEVTLGSFQAKALQSIPNLCLICFSHNTDFNSSRLFPFLLVFKQVFKANLISLILALV